MTVKRSMHKPAIVPALPWRGTFTNPKLPEVLPREQGYPANKSMLATAAGLQVQQISSLR